MGLQNVARHHKVARVRLAAYNALGAVDFVTDIIFLNFVLGVICDPSDYTCVKSDYNDMVGRIKPAVLLIFIYSTAFWSGNAIMSVIRAFSGSATALVEIPFIGTVAALVIDDARLEEAVRALEPVSDESCSFFSRMLGMSHPDRTDLKKPSALKAFLCFEARENSVLRELNYNQISKLAAILPYTPQAAAHFYGWHSRVPVWARVVFFPFVYFALAFCAFGHMLCIFNAAFGAFCNLGYLHSYRIVFYGDYHIVMRYVEDVPAIVFTSLLISAAPSINFEAALSLIVSGTLISYHIFRDFRHLLNDCKRALCGRGSTDSAVPENVHVSKESAVSKETASEPAAPQLTAAELRLEAVRRLDGREVRNLLWRTNPLSVTMLTIFISTMIDAAVGFNQRVKALFRKPHAAAQPTTEPAAEGP
jgi:hypothetical protein